MKETFSLSQMLEQVSDQLASAVTSIYSYVPHEKQKMFHCSTLEEKLFIGGNRSGKTVGNVIECIWWITKTHPFREDVRNIEGEVRGRLVTTSFKEGLEKVVLPMFKKWVPKKYLIGRSWDKSYSNSLKTLTLVDGSFIEFMSYDQELEKFAGTSRHFISFDEEPPRVIWQECLMRLIDTDGSWWISMTPVEGLTWVYEEIYKVWEDGDRPDTLVLLVNMNENPHLTQKGKDKVMKNVADEDERMAREEGRFAEIGGRIYKTFDKRIHVIPQESFVLQPWMKIYTSLDTGYRHPAAWLWHAVYPDGRIRTFHEIVLSERTIDVLAAMVHEYEKKTLHPLGIYSEDIIRTGDPAIKQTREITGTSVMQEYANHDIYIGVSGVTRDVDIGIIKVTQYMNTYVEREGHKVPLWACTDECTVLAKQMASYRWDKYASKTMEYKNAPKATPHKKDDDAPDSLRYFVTLMDDLTPDKLDELQKNPNMLDSVPYYDNTAPSIPGGTPYNIYEGSILYGMEG